MHIAQMGLQYRAIYDAFVVRQPHGLIYHSSRYIDFLVDLLGCEQMTLLAIDGQGEIACALPLLAKSGPFGKVLNSLPYYGSNGGILGADSTGMPALLNCYHALIGGGGVAAATIVENPLKRMDSALILHSLTDERIGQFTPIRYDVDHSGQLMASFHYKTRNMIRKAEKLGVTVAVENDQLAFVSQVHLENMREIGGLPKSVRFFELIPRYFRPGTDYRIHVARLAGEPVAALLSFYFNDTVEYYTPVVRKEYRETQALSAAIFAAMTEASSEGYHWWNWGGTWLTQEGVYRFKKRWGTLDFPYKYFIEIKNAEILRASKDCLTENYPSFYTVPFSALNCHQ
jgi:Acetyltransferase (GNAT) domain